MRQGTPTATHGKQNLAGLAIPAFLIVLPAVIFYSSLFSHLVNLPILDDYDALLQFLNQVVRANGMTRFWLFLVAQHNEYKLFFGNGVALAQIAVLGHVSFAQLWVLGDSAVLVLALLLWRMFLPGEKDLVKRLAYFVPVAWLLFQLEYWETLNWAMAGLQNLWVIVFCLGAIICLQGRTRKAYSGAVILYVLGIAASGNGFLLLPLGLTILVIQRRFARTAGWLAVSGACIAAYAYHYNPMSSQAEPGGSVFSTLLHFRPDYAIAFVGNAGAVASDSKTSAWVSLTLGTCLLLFFGWLVKRGYPRRNPLVSYCVLFLLMTAVGVAGLRSEFGLLQSLESRYTIYGILLVILAWTAFAEEFLQRRREALLNSGAYLVIAVTVVIFALCMDEVGYLNLARREQQASKGMAAFEHAAPGRSDGPVLPFARETAKLTTVRVRARAILSESIRLGVYEPPNF